MSKWKLHLEGLSERALPSVVAPSPFNPPPNPGDLNPPPPQATPIPPEYDLPNWQPGDPLTGPFTGMPVPEPIPDQYPNQPPLTPLPPGPGGTGIG